MELEFAISPKKLYEVEITEVRCTFRVRYNCQALQMYFYIKELDKTTSRTFDLPKTLRPTNSLFTEIVGKITPRIFEEDLLQKPNLLAKEVFKEAASKNLYALLSLSTNGKFIDVVDVRHFDESDPKMIES